MKFGKTLIMASLGWMLLQAPALADNDRPVNFNQLPANAQTLIKKHFGNYKFVKAEVEREDGGLKYEVELSHDISIEFNKNGKWKEIDCEKTVVPFQLIPQPVRRHVKKNYPNATIVKIERDHKKFEVELSNDVEITYDKNGKFLKVDK